MKPSLASSSIVVIGRLRYAPTNAIDSAGMPLLTAILGVGISVALIYTAPSSPRCPQPLRLR